MTTTVLWVTPRPVQFQMFTDALAAAIGTDTQIIYHRTVGTEFDELVAITSRAAADIVLLEASPGINPHDFARATNTTVLRPHREVVKNNHGVCESRFAGYAPVANT